MPTILGKTPMFWTRDTLLFEKLSPTLYKQSVPTSFGILLEELHWKYIQTKLGCVIVIPHSKISSDAPLWYNADGIGIIGDEFVLFEFKTPHSRKVTNNDIPAYYYDQVQVGLMLHTQCGYAYYSELSVNIWWDGVMIEPKSS